MQIFTIPIQTTAIRSILFPYHAIRYWLAVIKVSQHGLILCVQKGKGFLLHYSTTWLLFRGRCNKKVIIQGGVEREEFEREIEGKRKE